MCQRNSGKWANPQLAATGYSFRIERIRGVEGNKINTIQTNDAHTECSCGPDKHFLAVELLHQFLNLKWSFAKVELVECGRRFRSKLPIGEAGLAICPCFWILSFPDGEVADADRHFKRMRQFSPHSRRGRWNRSDDLPRFRASTGWLRQEGMISVG